MFRRLIILLALGIVIVGRTAFSSVLDGVEIVGEGHPNDILGIKPSVIYITTPRLTPLTPDLRMMEYLLKELRGGVNGAIVVYGEDPKVVAGFRERMGFPIYPAAGDLPEELTGEDVGLPFTLFYNAAGELVENRPRADVPDPMDTARVFGITYEAGPPGPPTENAAVPSLVFTASDKKTYDLSEFIAGKPQSIIYVLDLDDEKRERRLTNLQYLQDDLGEDVAVIPVLLNSTKLKTYRLADTYTLDLPVMIGSPISAHKLAGEAELPLLIVLNEEGKAKLVSEQAEVPSRNDITAEEVQPAEEGPPVLLKVQYLTRVTEGLQSNVYSKTSWTTDSADIVFNGRFGNDKYDHIFRVSRSGKNLHQITYGNADDVSPSCAVNGQHFTFCSTRTGMEEIWLAELLHGQFTRITKFEGTALNVKFGREGDLLIFERKNWSGNQMNYDLWVMTPIGRRARPVSETPYNEVNADMIRDTDEVVFQSDRYGNEDIFTSDLDGGKRRRLTTYEGRDVTPAYSPDGKYVAWACDKDGDLDIWLMNSDGSGKVKVTDGPSDDIYPCFSPNGRFLSFTRISENNENGIYKITFRLVPDYDGIRPQRYIRKTDSVYKDKYDDEENLDWLYPDG